MKTTCTTIQHMKSMIRDSGTPNPAQDAKSTPKSWPFNASSLMLQRIKCKQTYRNRQLPSLGLDGMDIFAKNIANVIYIYTCIDKYMDHGAIAQLVMV